MPSMVCYILAIVLGILSKWRGDLVGPAVAALAAAILLTGK